MNSRFIDQCLVQALNALVQTYQLPLLVQAVEGRCRGEPPLLLWRVQVNFYLADQRTFFQAITPIWNKSAMNSKVLKQELFWPLTSFIWSPRRNIMYPVVSGPLHGLWYSTKLAHRVPVTIAADARFTSQTKRNHHCSSSPFFIMQTPQSLLLLVWIP